MFNNFNFVPMQVPTMMRFVNPMASAPQSSNKIHSKRKFSPEEDERLTKIVSELGDSNWKRISELMGTRNYRQCRERWVNYLSPNVCRDPWTPEEDNLLVQKFKELGSQWSTISKFFKNRTDVNVKNRWVVISKQSKQQYQLDVDVDKKDAKEAVDVKVPDNGNSQNGCQSIARASSDFDLSSSYSSEEPEEERSPQGMIIEDTECNFNDIFDRLDDCSSGMGFFEFDNTELFSF